MCTKMRTSVFLSEFSRVSLNPNLFCVGIYLYALWFVPNFKKKMAEIYFLTGSHVSLFCYVLSNEIRLSHTSVRDYVEELLYLPYSCA